MNDDWKKEAGYLGRLADVRRRSVDALFDGHWITPEVYGKPESPIEGLMMEALLLVPMDSLHFTDRDSIIEPTLRLVRSDWLQNWGEDPSPSTREYAVLLQQVQIEDYRVDFLILVKLDNRGPYRIVIECDGHEFHDRTKEQAERDKSRDRELAALGCTVLRFTGREIWRDAVSCARDVARVIDRIETDTRPAV